MCWLGHLRTSEEQVLTPAHTAEHAYRHRLVLVSLLSVCYLFFAPIDNEIALFFAHTGPQERPMPGKLCKALVGQLARQESWGLNYAFDGRKNIYSPRRIFPAVRVFVCVLLSYYVICVWLCGCVCVRVCHLD